MRDKKKRDDDVNVRRGNTARDSKFGKVCVVQVGKRVRGGKLQGCEIIKEKSGMFEYRCLCLI